MFILNSGEFANFDLGKAQAFVRYWRQFYRDSTKVFGTHERIDYLTEIDPSRSLTVENVRRLLRWKDPKFLAQVILTGPNREQPNPRVERITGDLARLNDFRTGTLSESDFLKWARSMFPSSEGIWPFFLVHIARPIDYPIVDQHVIRAYRCHTSERLQFDPALYERYRQYFGQIAGALEPSSKSPLEIRKHVDDALLAFGQFLKRYGPGAAAPVS